jgi:hypothetical protein
MTTLHTTPTAATVAEHVRAMERRARALGLTFDDRADLIERGLWPSRLAMRIDAAEAAGRASR